MRHKIVAGNWKMNGDLATNTERLSQLKTAVIPPHTETIIFPPFPYLIHSQSLLHGSTIKVGGQNLSTQVSGAYTGEVSGHMLKDIDCSYVLVGHSERRALYHETDTVVAEKINAALTTNLTPVLCVGETLAERDHQQTETVIQTQLQAVINHCSIDAFKSLIIAYEPVWAIGTGKTATAEQAQAVHAFIRQFLSTLSPQIATEISILYGGSVKASSAASLFAMPDIDGVLVGGAALDAQEFIAIIAASSN